MSNCGDDEETHINNNYNKSNMSRDEDYITNPLQSPQQTMISSSNYMDNMLRDEDHVHCYLVTSDFVSPQQHPTKYYDYVSPQKCKITIEAITTMRIAVINAIQITTIQTQH